MTGLIYLFVASVTWAWWSLPSFSGELDMARSQSAASAKGKQVQVSPEGYARVVELAEILQSTMAHAASVLLEVADLDAAVERHRRAVSERLTTFRRSGSKEGVLPVPPSAPAGKPAAAVARPGSAGAAPARASTSSPPGKRP